MRKKKYLEVFTVRKQQEQTVRCDWPAGTGTITTFFCLVCPLPRQDWQGLEMTVPLPPQWRHVERITNGPVFTVSYRGGTIHTFGNTVIKHKHTLKTEAAWQSSHHAGAVAVVAVLDLGAWLVALAITALACCVYVNRHLFVDSLCCLSERQLHDVLRQKEGKKMLQHIHYFKYAPITITTWALNWLK